MTTKVETNNVVTADGRVTGSDFNFNSDIEKIKQINKNFLLTPPENAAEIILNARVKNNISAVELGQLMGFGDRSRVSMAEYENAAMQDGAPASYIKKVKPVTYTLFAIILGFHPELNEKFDLDNQLVFKVNQTKGVNFGKFLTEALYEQDVTIESLFAKENRKDSIIELERLKAIQENEVTPTQREWRLIQLAVNRYSSGFTYPDLILEGRTRLGYSQHALADRLGLVTQTISNYECRFMLPADHVWAVIMLALDIHPTFSMLSGNRDIEKNAILTANRA